MPPKNSKRLMADHGDRQSHAGNFSGTVNPNFNNSQIASQQESAYDNASSSNNSGHISGAGSSTGPHTSSPTRALKRHRSLATMRTTVPTSESISIGSTQGHITGSPAAAAAPQHHTFAVSSVSNQTSRPIRQRIAIACRYCRRRKIKCHGFDPNLENSKCVNCIRFNQECIFTPVSSVAAPVRAIHQHEGTLSMPLPQPGMHDIVPVPQRRAASLGAYYWRQPVPVPPLMTADQTHQNLSQEQLHHQHQHQQQQPPPPPPPLSQHHQRLSQPLLQHLPQVAGGQQVHAHHPHAHGMPGQLGEMGGSLLPPIAAGPGTHRIYLPPSHQTHVSPGMVGMPMPAPINVQQHQQLQIQRQRQQHQQQQHQPHQLQQHQQHQQVHQLPVIPRAPSLPLSVTSAESNSSSNVATAATPATSVSAGNSDNTTGSAVSATSAGSSITVQSATSSAAGDSGDDASKSRPRRLNIKDLVD